MTLSNSKNGEPVHEGKPKDNSKSESLLPNSEQATTGTLVDGKEIGVENKKTEATNNDRNEEHSINGTSRNKMNHNFNDKGSRLCVWTVGC